MPPLLTWFAGPDGRGALLRRAPVLAAPGRLRLVPDGANGQPGVRGLPARTRRGVPGATR